jgi:hypothetical protein
MACRRGVDGYVSTKRYSLTGMKSEKKCTKKHKKNIEKTVYFVTFF